MKRIHTGDCIEIMNGWSACFFDLIFADPPFNIEYEYDEYQDNKTSGAYRKWTLEWAQAVKRVLKPNGTFWLAIGDEYAAELKLLFQNTLGLTCRSWVIWYYTFGVNCKKKFSRSHVHLFHFVKDPKSFTFNADAIKVPSARQTKYFDNRGAADGKMPDDTWIFSRVCGTFKERQGWHGCQMPEDLMKRIILVSSNPEDRVLDPFAGSGTTLAVAKKLDRSYYGCELSSRYVRNIKKRLVGCTKGEWNET